MPERPWQNEYTLLCERCGYVIEGLDPAGNCPECGKPIVESLPERRVGTPWQQSPGVVSLVRTWWMTLRHPLRTLDVMRIDGHSHIELVARSILAGGILIWLLILTLDALNPASAINALLILLFGVVPLSVVGLIFGALTKIEQVGLTVISRSRRFRVTGSVAWNIVQHGTIGWLLCGLPLAMSLYCFTQIWMIDNGQALGLMPSAPPRQSHDILDIYRASGIIFLALCMPGFLFFETFAWLGLRRCRFANRVRPETGGEPEPESARTT